MLIPNLNPTAIQGSMLGGSSALFKSLLPIIEMLVGAYIGFWILSMIIKTVKNYMEVLTEKKEIKELSVLGDRLGWSIKEKDPELLRAESRFKELKKRYSDEYEFSELEEGEKAEEDLEDDIEINN